MKRTFGAILSVITSVVALSLTCNLANASDIQPAIAEFNALHFAKAKQLFTDIVKEEQHKNAANYYLGRIAMATTHYADAKAYFEASVALQPNSADEFYWLGNADSVLAQRGSMFAAPGLMSEFKRNTETALSIAPTHVRSLLSLYQFYVFAPSMMGGSMEKAEQLLSRLETASKAHADMARLFVLNNKKELDKATTLAQAMVVAYPGSEDALFDAGQTLSNNKQFAEAVKAFEKITATKATADNYLRVQGAYFEIGQVSVRSKTNIDQGVVALTKAIDPAVFPINGYTNWSYWRLSQLQQLKGDAAQQKQYLALLEKTGVQKDRGLEGEMNK